MAPLRSNTAGAGPPTSRVGAGCPPRTGAHTQPPASHHPLPGTGPGPGKAGPGTPHMRGSGNDAKRPRPQKPSSGNAWGGQDERKRNALSECQPAPRKGAPGRKGKTKTHPAETFCVGRDRMSHPTPSIGRSLPEKLALGPRRGVGLASGQNAGPQANPPPGEPSQPEGRKGENQGHEREATKRTFRGGEAGGSEMPFQNADRPPEKGRRGEKTKRKPTRPRRSVLGVTECPIQHPLSADPSLRN